MASGKNSVFEPPRADRLNLGEIWPILNPMSPLIRNFEDAERAAHVWMLAQGFVDATLTTRGADGGVDITSAGVIAQVKAQTSPVGQPAIQQLVGVAAVQGKQPLFFSLSGYTPKARFSADQAGVALFEFDLQGDVHGVNSHADFVLPDVNATTEFDLPFLERDCLTCGKVHQTGETCAECGADLPADPHVMARRATVEAGEALVETLTAVPVVLSPENLVPRLFRHFAAITAATSGVVRQEKHAETALAMVLVDLKALEKAIQEAPRDPIWSGWWPLGEALFDQHCEMVQAHLDLLKAPDPEQAGRAGVRIQATQDRSGQIAGEITGWVGRQSAKPAGCLSSLVVLLAIGSGVAFSLV